MRLAVLIGPRPAVRPAACDSAPSTILAHTVPNAQVMMQLDIRGELVEDVFNAVKRAGFRLPLDATEPRLVPVVKPGAAEDAMAVQLSHVPARVRVGI